jgi:formamidopyrimidine-DNA glycosylase
MPEAPEILFLTTLLKKKFIGGVINVDMLEISNYEIIDIMCKGKLLWLKLKTYNKFVYLHLHLGLTGWIVIGNTKNIKYSFSITKTNKEYIVNIEDKTKLSKLNLYDEKEHNILINKLGIDIFTSQFTEQIFKSTLQSKKMILASFLLKQELFCGIGNYIKNESMFLSNLDIHIKTNELTDENITTLYNNILYVAFSRLYEYLKNAKIEKSLPIDIKEHSPINLEIPYIYKIYKRKTTDDGKKVKIIKIGGRDTYYV